MNRYTTIVAAGAIALFGRDAAAQNLADAAIGVHAAVASQDSGRSRPKAIEYSDAYATRLRIHRLGSYAMLPLFAGEYYLGNKLIDGNAESWVRPAHIAVAAGLGTLFTVNTVTGVWNLVESRNDPAGRSRRLLHSALLIAADAGFAYTGMIASDAREDYEARNRHKNAAIVSMGLSSVGTAIMWFWKD